MLFIFPGITLHSAEYNIHYISPKYANIFKELKITAKLGLRKKSLNAEGPAQIKNP
jgi:hypothetical protein